MTRMFQTLLSVVGALVLSAPVSAAVSVRSPAEAGQELARAETIARDLSAQAAELQSMVRFPTTNSHQSHERKLNEIRADANELAEIVSALHQSREHLAKWQSELVTRMISKMQPLSSQIERAILFINEQPEHVFALEYRREIDDTCQLAGDLVRTVDTYRNYAKAKRNLEELTNATELD